MTSAVGVLTVMASAVVVLGGLLALVRSLLKFRDIVRDNTQATQMLTGRLNDYTPMTDGRLMRHERMLTLLWSKNFPGREPPQ